MDKEPSLEDQIPDLRLRVVAFISSLVFAYLSLQSIHLIRTTETSMSSGPFIEGVVLILVTLGMLVFSLRPTSWTFEKQPTQKTPEVVVADQTSTAEGSAHEEE